MFSYAPLDGYRDEQDAVGLPWERWEQEAGAEGRDLVDWLADVPDPRSSRRIDAVEAAEPDRPPGRPRGPDSPQRRQSTPRGASRS